MRTFITASLVALAAACEPGPGPADDPQLANSTEDPQPAAPADDRQEGMTVDEATVEAPAPNGIIQVPGAKFGRGVPGGTRFKGTLFLTFTGTDGRINILRWVEDHFEKSIRPEKSGHGSQMAVLNDVLYLAWVDEFKRFRSMKSNDGISWDPVNETALPEGNSDPGLVVYQGVLTAFVPDEPPPFGSNGIYQFNYNASMNAWFLVANIPYAFTGASPSAAVLGDDLVLSWVDQQGRVNTETFISNTGWCCSKIHPIVLRSHLIAITGPTPSLLLMGSHPNIAPDQIGFHKSGADRNFMRLGEISDLTRQRPHGLEASSAAVELAYRGTNDGLYWGAVPLPVP
jgi:hypothetical protein